MSILAAVHLAALTGPEQRVLGGLIEKRWTTPDQYPLSLNALRLACNQATNRDPVSDYDEATVRDAVQRLARYGLTRLASGHHSRAIKYRHLAEEGLGLDRAQLALLCVLLLRGPQTPGELKSRSERLSADHAARGRTAPGRADRTRLRPAAGSPAGQKEDRFEQLLGGDEELGRPGKAEAEEASPRRRYARVSPGAGLGQGRWRPGGALEDAVRALRSRTQRCAGRTD